MVTPTPVALIQPIAYVQPHKFAQQEAPTPTDTPIPTDTPAPVTDIERTITYNYDSLYRLTSAVDSVGDNRSYDYTYAFNGDRLTAKTFDGTNTTNDTYHYNLANQLTSANIAGVDRAFSYDDAGNLKNDGVNAYTYDAENRLLTANNAAYTYNGMGDRVQQTVGGIATDYLLDTTASNTQVLSEYTGTQQTNYLYGLDIIGQQQGADWSYLGSDGLGSTRMLTDASGNVTHQASYDPYGNLFEQYGPTASTFGYTGEQTDPSGLQYLRARYYDPTTGTLSGQASGKIGRNMRETLPARLRGSQVI